MKHLLLLCLLLISSSLVFSQQADSAVDCPKIIIEGPRGDKAYQGQKAMFRVLPFKKAYAKTHKLTYKWTTNIGRIVQGENENTVYVDTKNLLGEKLIVTVVIGGLEEGCKAIESGSVEIVSGGVGSFDRIIKGRAPAGVSF